MSELNESKVPETVTSSTVPTVPEIEETSASSVEDILEKMKDMPFVGMILENATLKTFVTDILKEFKTDNKTALSAGTVKEIFNDLFKFATTPENMKTIRSVMANPNPINIAFAVRSLTKGQNGKSKIGKLLKIFSKLVFNIIRRGEVKKIVEIINIVKNFAAMGSGLGIGVPMMSFGNNNSNTNGPNGPNGPAKNSNQFNNTGQNGVSFKTKNNSDYIDNNHEGMQNYSYDQEYQESNQYNNIEGMPSSISNIDNNKGKDDLSVSNPDINSFDVDKNLNGAFFSFIKMIIYFMLFILIGIIFALCVYNYVIFCYNTIKQALLQADSFNEEYLKQQDIYDTRLLSYVYCQDNRKEEDKECEQKGISYYVNTLAEILAPYDKCDSNSGLYIYSSNKVFNFVMNLIYIIIIIILMQFLIYIIVSIFLGGLRKYNIVGSNLISYMYEKGEIFVYILFLIFVYCLVHSIFFKVMFNDQVYSRIYANYQHFIKPDSVLHTEVKDISSTNQEFMQLLSKSAPTNIDVTQENSYNKKIIKNINDSTDVDVKASKVFVYAMYIFVSNRNSSNKENLDVDIIKKIDGIATQKPKHPYTIRSLIDLNIKDKSQQLNEEFTNYVVKIIDHSETDKSKQKDLKSKVLTKQETFFKILNNADEDINFGSAIYYLNIYLIVEWVINVGFIILLLVIMYFYADKDPFLKMIIAYIVSAILIIINELKFIIVGI